MKKFNSTLNFFYRTAIHWGWSGMGGQNVGLRGHGDLPQGHHSALYQSRCLKIQKIGAFERFGQNVAKKRSWKWQRWSQIARNYALVCSFFVILSGEQLIPYYPKDELRRCVRARTRVMCVRTCACEIHSEKCAGCACVWLVFGRAMCHRTFAHFLEQNCLKMLLFVLKSNVLSMVVSMDFT